MRGCFKRSEGLPAEWLSARRYQYMLQHYGLRDWQLVHNTLAAQHPSELLHRLVERIAMLLGYTVFLSIPGLMVLP
jgi:hypothetical protein